MANATMNSVSTSTFTFDYEGHKALLDAFRPRLKEMGEKILSALNKFKFSEASRLYGEAGVWVGDYMYGGSQPGESYWEIPYFGENLATLHRIANMASDGIGPQNQKVFFNVLKSAKEFATLHTLECHYCYYTEGGELDEIAQRYQVW